MSKVDNIINSIVDLYADHDKVKREFRDMECGRDIRSGNIAQYDERNLLMLVQYAIEMIDKVSDDEKWKDLDEFAHMMGKNREIVDHEARMTLGLAAPLLMFIHVKKKFNEDPQQGQSVVVGDMTGTIDSFLREVGKDFQPSTRMPSTHKEHLSEIMKTELTRLESIGDETGMVLVGLLSKFLFEENLITSVPVE